MYTNRSRQTSPAHWGAWVSAVALGGCGGSAVFPCDDSDDPGSGGGALNEGDSDWCPDNSAVIGALCARADEPDAACGYTTDACISAINFHRCSAPECVAEFDAILACQAEQIPHNACTYHAEGCESEGDNWASCMESYQ